MGEKERAIKFYCAIRNSTSNVHFGDILKLAESIGCVFKGINGDHHIYFHPKYNGPGNLLNFQPVKGKCKPYQVKQLIALIEDNDLLGEEGEQK
jgi:HicA toxin of bacterial toxin-antitoxin,